MNISTITIDRAEAEAKLRDYAALAANERTVEDELLREAYRAAARGVRLLNVQAAFQATGLSERGEPKLAVARADWTQCVFHPNLLIGIGHVRGAGAFTQHRQFHPGLRTNCFSLSAGTFGAQLVSKTLYSPLPHIPPQIRPRSSALSRYFILFEVERWQEYPIDPFLLRHIAGPFYTVEAEWELTTLEASLLSALAS